MRISKRCVGASLLVVAIVCPVFHAAGIGSVRDVSRDFMLVGPIEVGDYDKLVALIREKGWIPNKIYLNSQGGDVREAIRIGRFLRSGLVRASTSGECNSACLLIWVGAVERDGNGPFGLHRPTYGKSYFAGLSADEAERKFEELDQMVRSYLSDMDAPSSLADRMMAMKSTDLHLVSEDTILAEIGKFTPAYQEWLIAKCGELAEAEQRDLQAIIALDTINLPLPDPSDYASPEEFKFATSFVQALHERYRQDTEFATPEAIESVKSFPEGYREYLERQNSEIQLCRWQSIRDHRAKVMIDIQ